MDYYVKEEYVQHWYLVFPLWSHHSQNESTMLNTAGRIINSPPDGVDSGPTGGAEVLKCYMNSSSSSECWIYCTYSILRQEEYSTWGFAFCCTVANTTVNTAESHHPQGKIRLTCSFLCTMLIIIYFLNDHNQSWVKEHQIQYLYGMALDGTRRLHCLTRIHLYACV